MIMIKKKEFIGKEVKIVYGGKEFQGMIVNETKETFTLKTKIKERIFLKSGSIIFIENKKIMGKEISKKPEERIKSC